MPRRFDYGQSLLDAKNNTAPQPAPVAAKPPASGQPASKPVQSQQMQDALPQEQIERQQHPTAPRERFGDGLVEEREPHTVLPAKQMEFGGSGGSEAAEPVEVPPDENPAKTEPPKLRPKEEAVKILSPHGASGMDGYFEDEDEPDDLEPADGNVEPGDPEEYMPDGEQDQEVLARIEREQMEAKIRSEVEAEYADAGKKAGKTVGKQKSGSSTRVRRGVKEEDVKTSRLRNIPKCLVDVAKEAFPDATRQEDAVAAYIYFREGMPAHLVVPDTIAELAANYSGENVTLGTVRDIVERDVLDLKIQNRELVRKLEAIELATAFMIFETAGFRKSELMSPENIDFLEHGMADLMKRLEAQSELKRQRDRQREGRPIR